MKLKFRFLNSIISSPYFIFLIVIVIVFNPFFFSGLLPIPSDILAGAYYPWLDYKWGYPVGVPVKNPLPSDVISMLYPWRILGMSLLKQGQLPLWDPTILLGTPLLANFQSALLNPLNFLFFLISPPYAWSIQVIFQPLLISLTTYLFLKNLKIAQIPAIFGALAFAYCNFSITWMEYNTIGYTIAFIPLILFFIDKISTNPKVIYALFIAASFSLQLLSGYPQISLYTYFFSAIYFLYRLLGNLNNFLPKTLVISLGVLSSILLSAIQILPSTELLNLSIRSIDNTAAAGGIQFLPASHLITLFIPNFFGNPATGNYWSIGSYDNFAFSIPTAALFFYLLIIIKKESFNKQNLIFSIFLFLSLIYAVDNPLTKYLVSIDILGLKAAVATRALIFFDLALIVLASQGLSLVLSNKFQNKKLLIPFSYYIGILMGIIFSMYYAFYYYSQLNPEVFSPDKQEFYGHIAKYGQDFFSHTNIALRNSAIPLLISFLITTLLIFRVFLKKAIIFFIFFLLVIDIYYASSKYLSFTNPNLLYPKTPILEELINASGNHRIEKEKAEILPANTWIPYGLKTASGQNAIYPLSTSKYFGLLNNNALDNLPNRFVDITNTNSPLFNTLDIEFIAVLNRLEIESVPDKKGQPFKKFLTDQFPEYKNIDSVRILKNKKNLGLSWFSRKIYCTDNETNAAEIFTSQNYNPAELMVVECNGTNLVNPQKIGQSETIEERASTSKFSVFTENPNFLHISKAFFPGWTAFVDGSPTKIYRSNLALMAIFIPSGKHEVKLKYQPQTFRNGLLISSLAFVLWLIYLSYYFYKLKHD